MKLQGSPLGLLLCLEYLRHCLSMESKWKGPCSLWRKTLPASVPRSMSRQAWLAERRKTIGGSDAAGIVGLSRYATPYTVWADKTGRLPEQEDNEAMRQGRDLESTWPNAGRSPPENGCAAPMPCSTIPATPSPTRTSTAQCWARMPAWSARRPPR